MRLAIALLIIASAFGQTQIAITITTPTSMTTGASDPVAACAAPSTSNLALYTQTTTQDLWACVATNTWKKVLSTNSTGTYTATGAVGTAPSNPASGSVTCYYSSVSLTQVCLDSSGNAFSMVKTLTGRVANQFVAFINAAGIQQMAALALADLPAALKTRSCTVAVGDPGAASAALADDNDTPAVCGNLWGTDWTITSVSCWANAGSPTVTPILTGGSATSILTGALTCGTAAWAAGTVQGTAPVVHSFSANGATCAVAPCTIDANITAAGGTAKYIIVQIRGTI